MNSKEALKYYFGYNSFRKGQEEIIEAVLGGRDVIAVMPTGAGKSICYQIPALIMSGITLVISPLISLMQDQVKALNDVGIMAAYINSSLTEGQISTALKYASEGRYKIIYVAPERLENYEFLRFSCNADISMITIDEAHCISQWGQDFRPSYLKIIDFIKKLPGRPVISAFTATATKEVKEDIVCVLNLYKPYEVVTGFDRENLYFSVEQEKNKDAFVLDYVKSNPKESGIIYCATRKNADKLFELLFKNGIAVSKYHAGMDNESRKKSQDDFIYDRTPVVVATNAFGMGIDKSNVRFVIHYNMPQSMENYYQEAGRAGRDGEQSKCILLFSPQDIMINKYLIEKKEVSDIDVADIELIRERDLKRLSLMEGYSRTTDCLRKYILEYFGEKVTGACDNCGNCHRYFKELDMTSEAKNVINCVSETKGRYGIQVVMGTLLGANRARLRELGTVNYKTYGVLSDMNEKSLRTLISQMIKDGYLYQTDEKYSVLKRGDISPLYNDETRVIVKAYDDKSGNKRITGATKKSTDSLTSRGYDLFEILRGLRTTIARENALPPYIVFNDKTLIDMCVKLPITEAEFLNVSGVGAAKYEKYGEAFRDKIKDFIEANPGIKEESMVPEEYSDDKKSTGFDRTKYNRSKNRPDCAGASWTEEEDEKLDQEYSSGMGISEIAKLHERTRGGIRARLKKHGYDL